MITFKQFFESEENKDIHRTLKKIPKSHSSLVKNYNIKFQGGNTLKNDSENIGYIDKKQKEIVVAAPYNYGREFTFLHEIAHNVYDKLPKSLKRKWAKIIKNTKHKQNQSSQELFCMAYANYYAKNKIVIHDHPTWNDFIANLPK